MSQELSIPQFIASKLPDITQALPPNTIDAARLEVGFRQAFNAKPELRECTSLSIAAALLNCASLGIVPETPEKHAYLIPRKKKVGDGYEKSCELEVSYRGFVHLILRGDRRRTVLSDVVHEGDAFEFQNGDPVICRHTPNLSDPDRRKKPVVAAWALVVFPDGQKKLEVMDRNDLAKIEAAMMRQNFNKMTPAWSQWRTEMMRKAPIKRMAKTADLGPEIALAAELDNKLSREINITPAAPLILPTGKTIDALPDSERDPVTGEYKF